MRALSMSLLVAMTVSVIACQKSAQNETGRLEASKTAAVKLGEPVAFSANSRGDLNVNWQVTPSKNVVVRSSGNQASIFFNQSGTYSVTAISSQGASSATVTVTDSLYHYDSTYTGGGTGSGNGSGYLPYTTIPFTAGDALKLTPAKLSSATDSSKYLMITGITKLKYSCLNNYLVASVSESNGNYTITYSGVRNPGSACVSGDVAAAGNVYLHPVNDGTHNLTILFDGRTYNGTFTKAGGTYTFNWAASDITLSPSVLQ